MAMTSLKKLFILIPPFYYLSLYAISVFRFAVQNIAIAIDGRKFTLQNQL